MCVAALAAEVAGFNVLFRVVPQAARIAHQKRQQQAGDDVACQVPADGLHAADEAHQQRGGNGCKARGDQLTDGAQRGNIDAARIIRFAGAFLQAGDLFELAVDLFHHQLGVAVYAHNEHGREHGRDGCAHQHAEEHQRVHQVERDLHARSLDHLAERAQQGDDGQARRADGKALGDGLCGVAGCIQLVGDLQNLIAKVRHFRHAPGVVHDGAVGVAGDDQAHEKACRWPHRRCPASHTLRPGARTACRK